jgi:hypothetical protein
MLTFTPQTHDKIFQTGSVFKSLAIFLALSVLCGARIAFAQEAVLNDTQDVAVHVTPLPKAKHAGLAGIATKALALGSKPLYPTGVLYDPHPSEPLGNRTPLIIMPGRAQEAHKNAWWEKLNQNWLAAKHQSTTPNVYTLYKPYVYLFNSREHLEPMTKRFNEAFNALARQLPSGRGVSVVSYSLGGLLLEEAWVQNPTFQSRVTDAYAIAVPFGGSPMFHESWFTHHLKRPLPTMVRSPIRKKFDVLGLQGYLRGRNNLIRMMYVHPELDQNLPPITHTPVIDLTKPIKKPMDTATPSRSYYAWLDMPHTPQAVSPVAGLKARLTVYGSYLPHMQAPAQTELGKQRYAIKHSVGQRLLLLPFTLPYKLINSSALPLYGSNVHRTFAYGNKTLRSLPYQGEGTAHPYRLNDGFLSLASALYLPPSAKNIPPSTSVSEIATHADVKHIRIFEGVDHVDLGHYRLNKKYLLTQDILEQAHPAQTPLMWLFEDLVHAKTMK